MTKIVVDKKWVNEHVDFAIYNYFAEKKVVTMRETKEELNKKYGISLTFNQVQQIFDEYVKKGLLSQRKSNYIVIY